MRFGLRNVDGTTWTYTDADTPQFDELTETVTGRPPERLALGPNQAGVVIFDEDGRPVLMRLNTDVEPWELFPTQIHETGHMLLQPLLDDPESRAIIESLRPRLYELFAAANWRPENGMTFDEIFAQNGYVVRPEWTPEQVDYERLRESLAEFFRLYQSHATFLYQDYNDLVTAIRPLVNSNPEINRHIQLVLSPGGRTSTVG